VLGLRDQFEENSDLLLAEREDRTGEHWPSVVFVRIRSSRSRVSIFPRAARASYNPRQESTVGHGASSPLSLSVLRIRCFFPFVEKKNRHIFQH